MFYVPLLGPQYRLRGQSTYPVPVASKDERGQEGDSEVGREGVSKEGWREVGRQRGREGGWKGRSEAGRREERRKAFAAAVPDRS